MPKATTDKTAATTTTKTTADKPARSSATETTQGAAFNARDSKLATMAERAARAGGDTVKTTAHTVSPGQAVRQGGIRYTQGETVQLTDADSERLVAMMKVTKGDGGAKAVKANADKAAKDQAAADEAAEAQRIAEEKAAQDKALEAEAKGQLSGAENR